MIKSKIVKRDGDYEYIKVTGHAFGAKNYEGHDLICSAVSALAYTMVYALVELVGVKPIAQDGEGYFYCELPKELSSHEKLIQNTIVGTFEIGIRAISSEYPKNLKLETEEVESDA